MILKMWCYGRTEILQFVNLQSSLNLWKKIFKVHPLLIHREENPFFLHHFLARSDIFSMQNLTYRPKLFSIILLLYFSKVVWYVPKLPFILDYCKKSFSVLLHRSERMFFELSCLKLEFWFYAFTSAFQEFTTPTMNRFTMPCKSQASFV